MQNIHKTDTDRTFSLFSSSDMMDLFPKIYYGDEESIVFENLSKKGYIQFREFSRKATLKEEQAKYSSK